MGAPLFHVDVFATGPLTGNGLAVFLDADGWSHAVMQRLTREMKQFESIFLSDIGPAGATARVFTVEEELPFAGHPVLGAAAVLHRTQPHGAERRVWTLRLPHGPLAVATRQREDHYFCEMNQGAAVWGATVGGAALEPVLARLGLDETDLVAGISARVLSTGLPYLVVPVRPAALARAAIHGSDLEGLLGAMGAKFVLVLDVERPEMRTWDNLGQVEDVATGSAAGPAAAYLFSLGLADRNVPVDLAQGRFAGRPSRLAVVESTEGDLWVSGDVWPVSHGVLDVNPGGRISRNAPVWTDVNDTRSVRVLAISGSLRLSSTNTALVGAAARLAPEAVEVSIYRELAELPPFNPDLDGDRVSAAVTRFRARLQACDAVLISSPEYAHGVPGVLKNALDWIVGSGELMGKPIAVINASGRATHAWTSLRETLTVMSGRVIDAASITVPLDGHALDADGIVRDAGLSAVLRSSLEALVLASHPGESSRIV